MKNIAIIIVLLFVGTTVSAQHPLSKKGPKAKNYKASKDTDRVASKVSLFVTPSDKYASGANAKNTIVATESSEKLDVYPKNEYKRGSGANAKNRTSVELRTKMEEPNKTEPVIREEKATTTESDNTIQK